MIGPNLLGLALSALGGQTVQWHRFKSRSQNNRGQWITEYHNPTDILGSWQPVDAQTVKELGLDTSKRYHNLFTSHPVDAVNRGESPDVVVMDGRRHEVVGNMDWYRQNGWRGLLCVDVGPHAQPDPEPTDEPESP